MNQTLAAAGLLLIASAVAVGSGAFASGDVLTNSDADGSVSFAPSDGPSGAYAEYDDGRLTLVVDRLNPLAVTSIDGVFNVGYRGEGTAQVWIEHPSDRVTFYDGDGEPVENATSADRLRLSTNETASVGVRIDSGRRAEILDRVTLFAILPTSEDLDVSVPGSGGAGGGGGFVETPGSSVEDGAGGAGRSRLAVDLGEMNVRFRQPEFEYTTGVSRERVRVSSASTDLATVVDTGETAESEETVRVTGTVENTGEVAGTAVADLRVNGRLLETRAVDVEPGAEREVSFDVEFGGPGSYAVAVGDSEPVTVTVTRPTDWLSALPFALVAALASIVVLVLIRRRREEEDGG